MNKDLYELDKLFKENKFNQVVKNAKILIKSETAIAPFYNLLGLSLSKLGKDQEAEIIFLEGIKKFNDEISLKSNIATIQLNLKKLNEAEKNIKSALKINSEDIFTLFALGNLKRAQNKLIDAIEIFKKVCEKNVKFPKAAMYLGQIYLDLAQQNNDNKFYDLAKKNLLLYSEFFPLVTPVDYILSTIMDYSLNDFHQKKMLKKIFLILICSIIFFSCGKKGDPEYQGQKKQLKMIKLI